MRIAFVTHSLRPGGSERQLVVLSNALAAQGHDVVVVALRGGGALEHDLDAAVRSHAIDTAGHWYLPAGWLRLTRALRAFQPDVVHPYLGVPNAVVAVLRPFLRGVRLVWGIRSAQVEQGYNRLNRVALQVTVLLARIPDLIIVNSETGYAYHVERGYPTHKMVVIPNGIDTDRYQPDADGARRVREELGVGAEDRLVGLVARPDPVKDHVTFLRAAALVAERDQSVRFVCAGVDRGSLQALLGLDLLEKLEGRLHWLGHRDDAPAIYSALDVNCLSSISEGFPNVVAEAMACGTACVGTDVGDAARIVEGIGIVVPRQSPAALADGICALLGEVATPGNALGARARARIVERYSVPLLAQRTIAALQG